MNDNGKSEGASEPRRGNIIPAIAEIFAVNNWLGGASGSAGLRRAPQNAVPTAKITVMRLRLRLAAVKLVVAALELMLKMRVLHDYVFKSVACLLRSAYTAGEPNQRTLRQQWEFGSQLEPYFRRLLKERPASARAMVRFIGTWYGDAYRRIIRRQAGLVGPTSVVIEPTDRCNLLCPGCYANSSRVGRDMPFDTIVRIIGEVVQMGVSLITISGGEPFMREKHDQLLTRLARRFPRLGFLVYTNGTLIDQAVAERMGEVGNLFPAISVEGFEHQTDARRGRGIYQKIKNVRRLLKRYGVMSGFSATVTRENAESICTDEFIDLRIEEGDLFGWFFLMQPIGRSPKLDLMVTARQRDLLRKTIARWRQETRPVFLGDFWNDGHLVGGCIAGARYYFHIYANGDISPCVFSPIAAGNINAIWEGSSEFSSLAEFVQKNPVFQAFRNEQTKIHDRARPCLLIDHPAAFRRICQSAGCPSAKNMSTGYCDGEIAQIIDRTATAWNAFNVPERKPDNVMAL